MNTDLEVLKLVFFKKINIFSRWISSLSWLKFFIFIILIAIASDNIQGIFTDNVRDNWFGAMTGLFIVCCFGSKLLIASKIKADDNAFLAIEMAHEESLARQISESRFKVVQAQIDPHFLFNTLATLQYLISSDSKKAQELLTQTIIYFRYVLPSNNERKIITLGEELKACQAYLEIMTYRLTDRFNYDIELSNIPSQQPFPYTIIQNILDSCIRYGIETNVNPGYIKIYSDTENLIIENTIGSTTYATEQVNDIYLKNITTTLQSMGYKIDFDISDTVILKIKINFK